MGQPLVIRRRLGPMSDMRDQRLRGVKLNWNLAHITHPHTRHTLHSSPWQPNKQPAGLLRSVSLTELPPPTSSHPPNLTTTHHCYRDFFRYHPDFSTEGQGCSFIQRSEFSGCGFTQEGAWPHKTCCHGGETQSRIVSI